MKAKATNTPTLCPKDPVRTGAEGSSFLDLHKKFRQYRPATEQKTRNYTGNNMPESFSEYLLSVVEVLPFVAIYFIVQAMAAKIWRWMFRNERLIATLEGMAKRAVRKEEGFAATVDNLGRIAASLKWHDRQVAISIIIKLVTDKEMPEALETLQRHIPQKVLQRALKKDGSFSSTSPRWHQEDTEGIGPENTDKLLFFAAGLRSTKDLCDELTEEERTYLKVRRNLVLFTPTRKVSRA